jgi:hypothetical protein
MGLACILILWIKAGKLEQWRERLIKSGLEMPVTRFKPWTHVAFGYVKIRVGRRGAYCGRWK